MADHTPGPWKVVDLRNQQKGQIGIFSAAREGGRIANVLNRSLHPESDAQLIAAAPELLDALRRIQELTDRHQLPLVTEINEIASMALANAEER